MFIAISVPMAQAVMPTVCTVPEWLPSWDSAVSLVSLSTKSLVVIGMVTQHLLSPTGKSAFG